MESVKKPESIMNSRFRGGVTGKTELASTEIGKNVHETTLGLQIRG